MHVFWPKSRHWGPKGRLIMPFWSIFDDSENRRFSDVFLGRQKIDKMRPWSAHWSPCRDRPSGEGTPQWPQGPHTAKKKDRLKQHWTKDPDTPMGRRPGEFDLLYFMTFSLLPFTYFQLSSHMQDDKS